MSPTFGLVVQALELFLSAAAMAATKGNCAQSQDLVKGIQVAFNLFKASVGT